MTQSFQWYTLEIEAEETSGCQPAVEMLLTVVGVAVSEFISDELAGAMFLVCIPDTSHLVLRTPG